MTRRAHATPHRARNVVATGAMLTAGALVLASCASPGASASGAPGPSIVATTTQVGDFTRELVGDTADVTQLINSGQSAHGFDPSAAQLVALAEADALVVNGGGLESWLDDAVAASGFDGVLIDASTGIELFGTDDHGEHDDHGDGNPHIWTDPHLAEQMVESIGAGLATVPGLDSDAIAANEHDYLDKLVALDEWIDENVEQVPAEQRLLVTNHDAFTYFLEAYDITFVGSVIPSFDDNAEPSAADIDELVAKIRATGVQAVFSEASISAKAAETIARDADVKVYAGDDALYGDSLGPDGSDGATYLGSQEHNVRLILESWGVEPSPRPALLQG